MQHQIDVKKLEILRICLRSFSKPNLPVSNCGNFEPCELLHSLAPAQRAAGNHAATATGAFLCTIEHQVDDSARSSLHALRFGVCGEMSG